MKARAVTARMRKDKSTDDYRNACSGEGEFGSLGYEWADKPHRLVYDLCGEVDHLRTLLNEAETSVEKLLLERSRKNRT